MGGDARPVRRGAGPPVAVGRRGELRPYALLKHDRPVEPLGHLPSIDDPSSHVRNNAMRVLVMIQQSADTVVVPLTPVLRAMRFPTTTDRNKAAYLLAGIARHAPAADRARIARELGDVLVVMAAMQQPNNRDPAIDILKAISGEDHGTDAAAWRAWLDRTRSGK